VRSDAADSTALAVPSTPRRVVAQYPLAAYWILACAISWAWWIPMAVRGSVSRQGVGWPTHLPGLLGPAVAALAVTALAYGMSGVADLGRRLVRWRVGWRWWAAVPAIASLAVLSVLVLAVLGQPLPPAADFARYTGIGSLGLFPVILIALLLNGFGEETGWRGFAADHLLRRRGPMATSLLVAVIWGIWHLPMFWVVESFQSFGPAGIVRWAIGMTAGSVVLTYLYRGSGNSVLLVAAWHTAFNLTSATKATSGLVAAMSSTVVMVAAVVISGVWLGRSRRGTAE
jgi:membrane protease YdiL (CAAX protease family)